RHAAHPGHALPGKWSTRWDDGRTISGTLKNSGALAAIGPEWTVLNVATDIPVRSICWTKIQKATHPGAFLLYTSHQVGDGWAGITPSVLVVGDIDQPREGELVKIIHALDALAFLFRPAQHRQQQACQDGDDGDDNKQFDQRERTRPVPLADRRFARHIVV